MFQTQVHDLITILEFSSVILPRIHRLRVILVAPNTICEPRVICASNDAWHDVFLAVKRAAFCIRSLPDRYKCTQTPSDGRLFYVQTMGCAFTLLASILEYSQKFLQGTDSHDFRLSESDQSRLTDYRIWRENDMDFSRRADLEDIESERLRSEIRGTIKLSRPAGWPAETRPPGSSGGELYLKLTNR